MYSWAFLPLPNVFSHSETTEQLSLFTQIINAGVRTPSLKMFLSQLGGKRNSCFCTDWWVLWGRWKMPAHEQKPTSQNSPYSVSGFANCGSKAETALKIELSSRSSKVVPSGQSSGRLAGDCKKISTACFGLLWGRLLDQHLSLAVNSLTHPFSLYILKNLG